MVWVIGQISASVIQLLGDSKWRNN